MIKNYILLLLTFSFSAISYSQTCPEVYENGSIITLGTNVTFTSTNIIPDCNDLPSSILITNITSGDSVFNIGNCTAGGTRVTYNLFSGDVIDPNNFTVTWDLTQLAPPQTGSLVCTYVGAVLENDRFDIESTISISPNPVTNKDYFTLKLKNNMSGSYTLYNTLGKMIISKDINNSDFEKVDVSNLSQGIYLLRIKLNDNMSITKKIIISN